MKKLFTILALMLVAFTANAQIAKWMKPSKVSSAILKGDTNGDGEITVADVMLTVNYALGKQGESFNAANADVNGDGEITIADVMGTVSTILGGDQDVPILQLSTNRVYLTTQESIFNLFNYNHSHMFVEIIFGSGSYTITNSDPNVAIATLSDNFIMIEAINEGTSFIEVTDTQNGRTGTITVIVDCPDNHHPHMIDLGLPSGTKWACCNVGAGTPTGYGGYYAWGEITTKTEYTWSTYLYFNGGEAEFETIAMDIAGTEYDVAHVKWGDSWVMPSSDQIKELLNNCTSQLTTRKGVEGRTFIGPSGAILFLPAAGCHNDPTTDIQMHKVCLYWSSTVEKNDNLELDGTPTYRCAYYLGNDNVWGGEADGFRRYYGLTVRPVSR